MHFEHVVFDLVIDITGQQTIINMLPIVNADEINQLIVDTSTMGQQNALHDTRLLFFVPKEPWEQIEWRIIVSRPFVAPSGRSTHG